MYLYQRSLQEFKWGFYSNLTLEKYTSQINTDVQKYRTGISDKDEEKQSLCVNVRYSVEGSYNL
jgi:hypothetical protein